MWEGAGKSARLRYRLLSNQHDAVRLQHPMHLVLQCFGGAGVPRAGQTFGDFRTITQQQLQQLSPLPGMHPCNGVADSHRHLQPATVPPHAA